MLCAVGIGVMIIWAQVLSQTLARLEFLEGMADDVVPDVVTGLAFGLLVGAAAGVLSTFLYDILARLTGRRRGA